MSIRPLFRGLFQKPASRRLRSPARRPHLYLEALETRLVPYNISGYAWPHPELVTLSFVPDGTNLGGSTSNLFATFNAKFGSQTAWQNQILKAAQVWAQQTNLNFSLVSDSGADTGSGNYQQGDPGVGDIRIAGFNFNSSTLAMAYMPPSVNNYSVAGDIAFNTGQTFNIGSTYDLFTVAAHEIGHALGLLHSDILGAVLYPTYNTRMTGLSSDDTAGIRNIYSNNNARSADAFYATYSNGSLATAADISSQINTASETALLSNLDITTTSEKEYYQFTAPTGSSNTLTVKVQSSGLSLLAPTLTVYNGCQTQLATVSGAGRYGTTLTLTISGVTAGSTYYVKVAGADSTAFGTGKYALTLNLGTGASPTVPLPNTQTADGNPASGGGGQAFNPSVVQQATTTSTSGGLLGGVVRLVGTVVTDALGLLHDAAGAFDLLDVPGVTQQTTVAEAASLHFNLGAIVSVSPENLSPGQHTAESQTPAPFMGADTVALQASDDQSILSSFIAGLASRGQHSATSWSQESEAYFANDS